MNVTRLPKGPHFANGDRVVVTERRTCKQYAVRITCVTTVLERPGEFVYAFRKEHDLEQGCLVIGEWAERNESLGWPLEKVGFHTHARAARVSERNDSSTGYLIPLTNAHDRERFRRDDELQRGE